MCDKSSSKGQAFRPKSAKLLRASYHKQYRLNDNQSLNNIREQINHVFKNQNNNKSYQQVKDLTSKVNSNYGKRIDRMCVQYGIKSHPSQQMSLTDNVDVQVIAKSFIRAKSKDLQKQNQRKKMKRAIQTIVKRYQPTAHEEFFELNYDTIRRMEIKAKKKRKTESIFNHPYIAIYQKTQHEALNNLLERNKLTLEEVDDHPQLVQIDEWQKQSRQIRKIYTGVKQFRSNTLRNSFKNTSRGRIKEYQSIYIT